MGLIAARETERTDWSKLLVYEVLFAFLRAAIIWYLSRPAAWVMGLLLISPGLFALCWLVHAIRRESMWRLAKLVDAFTQVALCGLLLWVGVPDKWWLPLLIAAGLAYLAVTVTRLRALWQEVAP